ncbi:lactococcin 972 family bacteriocin [Streptomyces sp. G3]|uniref:lactococcin 972 family bacteriocin n=1 Tax=unclassified Streptomyces TaxID=2593676 RepID=UPI0013C5A6F1|nr:MULTISPECIES: lactococcin 972 family bacteriocin [unclassified Streptomyces]MCM1941121.1 lactococcin 972 family bacteriocin [Streptomyces sp. G3]NDZ76114.1 lactococcin 972 family bacteriocin [Streptomyces sp. SID10362]
MLSLKNSIKAVAATGAVVMAFAAPALAAEDAGGGKWSHGVGANYVYSNYYHKDNYHSSSVEGAYWAKSGCTKEKVWSKASAKKSTWALNKAYYDPAC